MSFPLVWKNHKGIIHFIVTDFDKNDIDFGKKQQILCEPGWFYEVFKTRDFNVNDLSSLCNDCKKIMNIKKEK
jgi:hypothetical protein